MERLNLEGVWDEVRFDLCRKYPELNKARLIYVRGRERRLVATIATLTHLSPDKVEEELVNLTVQKLVV